MLLSTCNVTFECQRMDRIEQHLKIEAENHLET
jgi:hypothetical protein